MESTKTTEELLQQHKRWTYVRTDRNNTRYFHDYTCQRCGGRGGWEGWPDYVCYECGGSGKSDRVSVIKVYTPEHAAKLAAQREARAAKAEAERTAKAILERGENLKKAGFGQEEIDGVVTWVIYRVVGNTFDIKDQLKELGCKFKPSVGWYAPAALEGYECQRLTEKDVLKENVFIEWKDKEEVEPLWIERNRAAEESPSQWVGQVGDRIDITVTIDRVFESQFQRNGGWYGTTTSYMYLMHDEAGNVYKWSTSKCYNEKETYHFRATVKDHADYKGIKQTVITRATLIKE
jgi:hypothetical protein